MKILVVDDEPDICEILQYNLETEGYEVETANSAEEALQTIRLEGMNGKSSDMRQEFTQNPNYKHHSYRPDLILLDVMMGDMSGFQMARLLKDNPSTRNIPIIFITALDGEDDTVKGLNLGADDYIAKPLSLKEVKARVKAVLRRTSAGQQQSADSVYSAPSQEENTSGDDTLIISSDQIKYEGLCLNLDSKTATVDGQEVTLTKLEYELLALLLQHPNKVFSREKLLTYCWPSGTNVLDRTVDVNITRLRKKIGVYGKRIKTRFGYGYSFVK